MPVRDWPGLCAWAAATLHLSLDDAVLAALQRYVELLRFWNRKVALVSQQDLPAILVKHVADSLVAAAHCAPARRVADLGSGAGFPGLVIALVHPGTQVTLIEARGRKVSFLEEAVRTTPVPNARILHARIETVAEDPSHANAYDLITSRALADIDRVIPLARPLATPDGRILCMRAATPPTRADSEEIAYALPDGTPRQLTRVLAQC